MSMGGSRGIVPSGESALLMCHRFPSKAPQNNDDKFRGLGCLKNRLQNNHLNCVQSDSGVHGHGFTRKALRGG